MEVPKDYWGTTRGSKECYNRQGRGYLKKSLSSKIMKNIHHLYPKNWVDWRWTNINIKVLFTANTDAVIRNTSDETVHKFVQNK